MKFPLIMLRILGELKNPVQQACCLLAYGQADSILDLLNDVDAETYRSWLDQQIIQSCQGHSREANCYIISDLWKIARIATGELSWREFAVWSAVQSVIGKKRYNRMTVDTIRSRASGYFQIRDIPDQSKLLTRDQARRTRDKLRGRDLLRFYQLSPRAVYYCSWRVKKQEFGMFMTQLQCRLLERRNAQKHIDEFISKAERVQAEERDKAEAQALEELRQQIREEQTTKRSIQVPSPLIEGQPSSDSSSLDHAKIPGIVVPVRIAHADRDFLEFPQKIRAYTLQKWQTSLSREIDTSDADFVCFSHAGTDYAMQNSQVDKLIKSQGIH